MPCLRHVLLSCIIAAVLVSGCASADPEVDENDNNQTDTDADLVGDVDGDDADAGTADPCDLCESHEACSGGTCIDPCAQQQTECGTVDYDGDEFFCGQCAVGSCDDGQCQDVCEGFFAECGQVTWQGNDRDCGSCSGLNRCIQNQCTSLEGFIDIAAGRHHNCGLRNDGQVRCWGRNQWGQLGDNSDDDYASTPGPVFQLNNAATLSSFNNHSCTSRDDDHIYCWGSNGSGRLGDGTTDDASAPVRAQGVTAPAVATGGAHSCALLSDQKIVCWGDNGQGQLGNGESLSSPSFNHDKKRVVGPTPGNELGDIISVDLGSAHSCAVDSDNQLWCWGHNRDGQLGHGDNFDEVLLATRVTGLAPVARVATGFNHTCSVAIGGDLHCWGRGREGQLGDEDDEDEVAEDRFEPVAVELDEPVIDVATGRFHTCAATAAGQVYCWGQNSSGQIGQGSSSGVFTEPVAVDNLDNIHRVIAGSDHSCALDRDGDTYCWGDNEYGQIGDGSNTFRPSPTLVQ